MALSVETSNSSGIPDRIYLALSQLGSVFPGDWLASLVPAQTNEVWQLKLRARSGALRTCDIWPEDQGVSGVQRALRELASTM